MRRSFSLVCGEGTAQFQVSPPYISRVTGFTNFLNGSASILLDKVTVQNYSKSGDEMKVKAV